MMQTHGGELCIGWLHGLGVTALHSKVPCTYSVCNPGLFDETRLSTLCRDDLAFNLRSSPDGSADDLEVGKRNIINSTRIHEGHFKTELATPRDGSGCRKTGFESQCKPSDPVGKPDREMHENKALPVTSIRGPVASESRGELLECEDAGLSTLEDLLRHYWLLRDSEEEIQKTKSRREPVYDQSFNWLLKKSYDETTNCESSSSEAGEECDEKGEISFERDETDSLASLSTISEEDPEEMSSSADPSNRIDALFGDPDRQDFRRLYQQRSRPSTFGVENAAEVSTEVDELFENEPTSSRDYGDSWENLDDGEEGGKGEGGKPTSNSSGDRDFLPQLKADDTFARIFSCHVTDTCPSFSPDLASQESDVEDGEITCAPSKTADDPKDTEANSQAKANHDEYTVSDTRVHLNLIASQDDHQTTDGCLDESISNGSVTGKEIRSSSVASPASWYTVSDVFVNQSFEIADIADNLSESGDGITMSKAYAKCTAIYRYTAADSSATDSPATCFSVSTKVTAADPVTALSRATSKVTSLAAAKACPVSACSRGNLEISLTASCSLSPTSGDLDSIATDEGTDADVFIDADLRQAFDTVDIADLRKAFDTVDHKEPRCCNIQTDLSHQKPRFISMIDSATETTNSVADVAVQSDITSFPEAVNSSLASTRIWNSTHMDALGGEDDDTNEEVFVLAEDLAEAGRDFSCQIALPSAKAYGCSKSSGYGSRSSSDDLLGDPDDCEITGVAVKELPPKFKTPMPQNTDANKENEESDQKLETRGAIEVKYSDQNVQRNIGKELGTPIWIDGSIENRISGQEPLFEKKPTNDKISEKSANEDSSNFVHRYDVVIPTDRGNDARLVIDTDLRQAFDTVDNAEPRCCNIEVNLPDQKIQGGGSLDNQKDICHVGGATEEDRRHKNREFIGFASRDYVPRRDTSRGVSRPVIRSRSLLLETDIDTLEHHRTVVAGNTSMLSVGVNNIANLLLADSKKQRCKKSRDYFSWDSTSDLLSKEDLEYILCNDSPPRYFAKKRANQSSDSHDGEYYNSEPNLKPNVNKGNSFSSSRNSSEITTGKDIPGASKKPDKLSLETRDERTLDKNSVDQIRSPVSTDHHHDGETRNAIERYDSSPSLRRRSLSILTTPSSGRRKNYDVTPETESKPEVPSRSPKPVSSSFENLVDSLLGITAVMSMETAVRCGGPSPPFASSKGGVKPRGSKEALEKPSKIIPIPPSNERRTFAKPSPSQNETTGGQGRMSSSLPPLVPLSVSPDPAQSTPARSLPVVRKHEHFRKAKHIFLKCGSCIEGKGTSVPAKGKGKAPVALGKKSKGVEKKQ